MSLLILENLIRATIKFPNAREMPLIVASMFPALAKKVPLFEACMLTLLLQCLLV